MKKSIIFDYCYCNYGNFSACEKDKSIVEEVKPLNPTEQKILNFKE